MEQLVAVTTVVVFVVLFFVGVFKLQARAAKKRTEAWRTEATRLGLSFVEELPTLLDRRELMTVFETDGHAKFANVVSGELLGYALVVAEHSATVSSSERSYHYSETVCILQLPGASVPHFGLTKKSFLADSRPRKGAAVSFADDPEFDNAFRLQGRDEAALRRTFTRDARRAVAQHWGAKLQIEGGGQTLVIHRCETIAPGEIEALVAQARSLATVFMQTV
jgi:hypothetical protein